MEVSPPLTGDGNRDPDLLADMAPTVGHVSEGWVILGLGSCWFERDHQSSPRPATRLHRTRPSRDRVHGPGRVVRDTDGSSARRPS